MRVPLLVLLLTLQTFAQEAPEIRGTVLEFATDAPIPSVQVVLSEGVDSTTKVIDSVLTGANGSFTFKPGRVGDFVVQAKKDGYLSPSHPLLEEAAITLTPRSPVSEIRLELMRPGELSGRVINSINQPIPNLSVSIESSELPPRLRFTATTDADGVFIATNLPPDSYRVHIVPSLGAFPVLTEFSEAAFQIVDHDLESTYWPGGRLKPEDALPITVASGLRVNVGTIKTREVLYYRVRVAVLSECSPEERWSYFEIRGQAANLTSFQISRLDCREQFLLRNVLPGDLNLAFWNSKEEPVKWGWLPLHVSDHNTTAQLTMSTGAQVVGRILAASGTTLDAIGSARTRIGPVIQGIFIADRSPQAKSENTFVYRDLAWETQELSVTPDRPGTYVKEIRYNGVPLNNPVLDLLPTGSMEIVLDGNAASLAGTVNREGKPVPAVLLLVRWPAGEREFRQESLPPYQYFLISTDGRFSFQGLAPGDYRILALPPNSPQWREQDILQRLLSRADRVTLERGSQRSLDLKLTDPTR